MTNKTKAIKIRIDAYLPIPASGGYSAKRDAYAVMSAIEETGKLPDGFFDKLTITNVTAKEGGVEAPAPVVEPVKPPETKPETKPAKS